VRREEWCAWRQCISTACHERRPRPWTLAGLGAARREGVIHSRAGCGARLARRTPLLIPARHLAPQAQNLVDASELSIERFALTRPMGDTAEASVDATLSMPRLSFGAALRGTQLILRYGEEPVGTLTAGNWIPLGYGGEVKLTLAGLISVTHYDAFKHLAAHMILHDNLTLGLRGGLTLGVPPIPLPVGAALVREVALRGAAGLDLQITYFSFRDGLPEEFPERAAPFPLMLEILVEVHNPSSFDFSPLGQLQLGIASESGLRFAMVRARPGPSRTPRSRRFLLSSPQKALHGRECTCDPRTRASPHPRRPARPAGANQWGGGSAAWSVATSPARRAGRCRRGFTGVWPVDG
jgi:hypothetical protein